uniref:Uncharacterized protein n=1 Tax=Oryza brachyantha TaxID=4533 RepID=J3ML02_ORYBR
MAHIVGEYFIFPWLLPAVLNIACWKYTSPALSSLVNIIFRDDKMEDAMENSTKKYHLLQFFKTSHQK